MWLVTKNPRYSFSPHYPPVKPGRCSDYTIFSTRVNGFHKDFGDGETIVRQIMVGERVGLVTIVEEHHPPGPGGRRLALWHEDEAGGFHTPDGLEVTVPLLVKGGQHSLHSRNSNSDRFVDDSTW